MPSQMVLPTVDVQYLFRFERTLAGLEKGLHNDDDPEEIAMQTIEVARDFYDADWCGTDQRRPGCRNLLSILVGKQS